MSGGDSGSADVGGGGSGRAEARLAQRGTPLPSPARPLADYVPALVDGASVMTSGQLPMVDGALALTGKVGAAVSAEQGADLARICVLNALAAIRAEIGDLDRIARVAKLTGYVASDPSFTGQSAVIDGASELLGDVFGAAGTHTRSAVGVAVLPLDAPVELDLLVTIVPKSGGERA